MRGNSNADNGKNIRHNFVSQSLPHHNSMQEFEQREVKNGNKEKKQKGYLGKAKQEWNEISQGCCGVGYVSAL